MVLKYVVFVGTTADQQAYNGAFRYSIRRTRVTANCRISGAYCVMQMMIVPLFVSGYRQYFAIQCFVAVGMVAGRASSL